MGFLDGLRGPLKKNPAPVRPDVTTAPVREASWLEKLRLPPEQTIGPLSRNVDVKPTGWLSGLEERLHDIKDEGLRGDPLVQRQNMGITPEDIQEIVMGSIQPMESGEAAVAKVAKKLSKSEQAKAMFGVTPQSSIGRIVNATNEGGGYSIHLPTGQTPSEGIMMGKYANTDPRNMVIEGDKLRRGSVLEHAMKNAKALQAEDNYLGTWIDKGDEAGAKTYLDVSRRFKPGETRKAVKFGERTGQKAGWDVGKGEVVPVGNWEEFVKGTEFEGRLDELEAKGRAYLQQHANPEWWDMHGGPFERIYGPENLDKMAGFIASTAPNAAPRENLQTASEYMRRLIKGEPILQPEWRVPDTAMSRKPGSKIGMEKSRRANLVKASQGDLAGLQKDKVREEAAALMGDPNAFVGDRWWARVAEKPSENIFTEAGEGMMGNPKVYKTMKASVLKNAQKSGRPLRDFSADVWTGIREMVKETGELFGAKYDASAIRGDSKGYGDHLMDLVSQKAKHLGISVSEMEARLRSGDAELLSTILTIPAAYEAYQKLMAPQAKPDGM